MVSTKIPELYWMIGISGSGKSCEAILIHEKTGATIVSSDKVRRELYGDENIQGDPHEVFQHLHKKIIDLLNQGVSVIYDATNLSLKNRLKFFNLLKDKEIEAEHHAIVMSKSIDMCIHNNNQRDRIVPEKVIKKQAKQFNMPFFEEGFKSITIQGWKNMDCVFKDDKRYFCVNHVGETEIINRMDKFNQNNPHHDFTLGTHCDRVYQIVKNFSDDSALITASLFHDVGKLYTEEKDKKGISHYYGHAEVGTYNLLQNLDAINGLGMKSIDVIKSLFYICYHMRPFDWNRTHIKEKYRNIFGNELYNNLWLLHNADIRGCKKDDKIIFDA